eukprot:gene8873-9785_t
MLRKNALISQSARRFLQKHQTTHQLLQAQAFTWSALRPAFLNEVPKGFDRYFRKNNNSPSSSSSGKKEGFSSEKTETNKASEGGQETKKSDSTNKNNKGGKKPDPFDPEKSMVKIALMIGGLGLASYLFNDGNFGREITWQDFQKQLLETGQVDRIIVSNKNVARVVLRAQSQSPEKPSPLTDPSQKTDTQFGWASDTLLTPSTDGEGDATGQKFGRYPSVGAPVSLSAPYYFQIGTVESFERKLEEAQRALGIAPRDFIPVVYVQETSWTQEIMRFLPTILLIGVMMYTMKNVLGSSGGLGGSGGPGGIFRVGKSNAKKINKEQVKTTFADVAGCDEAKKEIMEFVQFLKEPQRFTNLGARIPKGALLCGPPGTGKTLLAKATAGEASVPFYSISGSDFVEMFVGVGPSRVRDLFKEARENAPCIIFIDEIDAVGRQRGRGGLSGSNDERENTLNQLLVEMDGFDATTNVVILAGTNRVDILDSALTRPGRFDRQITVDKPDIAGRKAIFDVYLKNLKLNAPPDTFSNRLAALTPGFVGADIANICNEAAIQAARKSKEQIDITDFEAATDRIIGGLESRKVMSIEEKRVVAYHEAGHAVAGWHLEYADPLLKVTIVPRSSGALGFAQYLPKELFLRTREQIMDMVCMALAGRASEQVNFGRVTTGAADDLRRVTQIAYQMVQVYGMNERIGQVAFPREEGSWPNDKMYSNATAELMDTEVRQIIDEAYKRTLELIEGKKEDVRRVAELLMDKETITNADIAKVIGARPFSAGKDYEQYINAGWKPEEKPKEEEHAHEEKKEEKEEDSHVGGLGPIPTA